MRPITFNPAVLRRYLLRHQIAELPQLKRVLGTSVDLTVFRKLQHLGYLTSYSHRGRFYTTEALELSADELQAAILLFYGLLDEQQRRLFAGIESLRLGHGGDKLLAEFLGLDVHTVARGREQLLEQEVSLGRIRRIGGGRSRAEKKTPRP